MSRIRAVRWVCVLDTAAAPEQRTFQQMDLVRLQARSLIGLRGELLPGV
jgi:hypothetical protein